MKLWLNLEHLALATGPLVVYWAMGGGFLDPEFLWILAPDLGLVGYVFGARFGALSYNLTHSLALGIGALVMTVLWAGTPSHVWVAGLLQISHVGFDRLMGHGLKRGDSFHETHLGRIGKR